jgi:hypothetical protein
MAQSNGSSGTDSEALPPQFADPTILHSLPQRSLTLRAVRSVLLSFDLLFIGFPLGAFVAARWLPASRRSLLRSRWGLQAIMAVSIGCCLLAKRFDYLRAHLFDIELGKWASPARAWGRCRSC